MRKLNHKSFIKLVVRKHINLCIDVLRDETNQDVYDYYISDGCSDAEARKYLGDLFLIEILLKVLDVPETESGKDPSKYIWICFQNRDEEAFDYMRQYLLDRCNV